MTAKIITGILLLQFVIAHGIGQNIKSYTLKEAQQYAIENNYDVKNAGIDVQIAQKRVKENLATTNQCQCQLQL